MPQSAQIMDIPIAAKSSAPKPSSTNAANSAQDSNKQDSFANVLEREKSASSTVNKNKNNNEDKKPEAASNDDNKQQEKVDASNTKEAKTDTATSDTTSAAAKKAEPSDETTTSDEDVAASQIVAQQTADPVAQDDKAEQQLLALINSLMLAKSQVSDTEPAEASAGDVTELVDKMNIDEAGKKETNDQDAQGKAIGEKLHALVDQLLTTTGTDDTQGAEAATMGDKMRALFSGNEKFTETTTLDNKALAKALAEIVIAKEASGDRQSEKIASDIVALDKSEDKPLDDPEQLDQFTRIFEKVLEEPFKLQQMISKDILPEKLSTAEIIDDLANKLGIDGADRSGVQTSGLAASKPQTGAAQQTSTIPLPAHIKDPEWAAQFSNRMALMVNNKMQNAELRLHPQELGHINVKISVANDQASIIFQTPHGAVREAIEAAMPRLREMLQDSGLGLANVDVSSQNQSRERGEAADGDQQYQTSSRGNGSGEGDGEHDMLTSLSRARVSNHLVDYYA